MAIITSPNMGLTIPITGVELGPAYANDINNSLSQVDIHNHTTGLGVPIPSAGLDINADLPFGVNNATALRSVRFTAQGSPLNLASDLICVYASGVDLYYNDGNGNQVRITQSGGVAGSPGSITGLVSPASATYVSANQTFVWQSDSNTPANLDAGSVVFRNITSGSNGITLSAPAGLGSNYSLTLPSLPGSKGFLTLDSAGTISNVAFSGGILGSNIAAGTITTNNISSSAGIVGIQLSTTAAGLTPYQMGASVNDYLSSPVTGLISGTVQTVSSLTLTIASSVRSTTGFFRPVFISFTSGEFIFSTNNATIDLTLAIKSSNGLTLSTLGSWTFKTITLAEGQIRMPANAFSFAADGSLFNGNTIVIQVGGSTSDGRVQMNNVAYTVFQI